MSMLLSIRGLQANRKNPIPRGRAPQRRPIDMSPAPEFEEAQKLGGDSSSGGSYFTPRQSGEPDYEGDMARAHGASSYDVDMEAGHRDVFRQATPPSEAEQQANAQGPAQPPNRNMFIKRALAEDPDWRRSQELHREAVDKIASYKPGFWNKSLRELQEEAEPLMIKSRYLASTAYQRALENAPGEAAEAKRIGNEMVVGPGGQRGYIIEQGERRYFQPIQGLGPVGKKRVEKPEGGGVSWTETDPEGNTTAGYVPREKFNVEEGYKIRKGIDERGGERELGREFIRREEVTPYTNAKTGETELVGKYGTRRPGGAPLERVGTDRPESNPYDQKISDLKAKIGELKQPIDWTTRGRVDPTTKRDADKSRQEELWKAEEELKILKAQRNRRGVPELAAPAGAAPPPAATTGGINVDGVLKRAADLQRRATGG